MHTLRRLLLWHIARRPNGPLCLFTRCLIALTLWTYWFAIALELGT